MSEIWTIFRITDTPTGMSIEYASNDDDDDGYPDGKIVRATYYTKTLGGALEITGGKSRIGLHGQPVDVYLNGMKI